MARGGREQGISLNFDSLTDTITNLAGTLILVVVLVLGATSPANRTGITKPSEPPPAPPPPPPPPEGQPVAPLLEQAEVLRVETQALDRALGELERTLPELQRRAVELLGKTSGGEKIPGIGPLKTAAHTRAPPVWSHQR